MTPAELLAAAKRLEKQAAIKAASIGDRDSWYSDVLACYERDIADLRLAARLARFAAERGGLEEEETDGKA